MAELLIEMVFLYGSLTRPPDVRSNTVCSWLMFLLSPHRDYGTLSVDDIIVVMQTLEDSYVPRYEQFCLANLHQILELAVGENCCDFLMLLSIHLYYGIICAGDAIGTFWNSLEAHREGELRISVKQILQFPVNRKWLDFWTGNHVIALAQSDLKMFSKLLCIALVYKSIRHGRHELYNLIHQME